MIDLKIKTLFIFIISFLVVTFSSNISLAQQVVVSDLEIRVEALERYFMTIQPTLEEFSSGIQKSISAYTNGLEKSLLAYSQELQSDLNIRIENIERDLTLLDISSQQVSKVDTNVGSFLLAVTKVEEINGGVKLYVDVGNPNFANYRDFKVKLFWGRAFRPNDDISYQHWRSQLKGAEYAFQGGLKKGQWNPIQIDLVPANLASLSYVECELELSSIELQKE